jgi:hypothetical protein
VTTEAQRSAFSAQLADMEDWLYGDGDEEGATAFKAKLADLKKVGGAAECCGGLRDAPRDAPGA